MRFVLAAAVALVVSIAFPATAGADWVWPLRGEVITPYRNVDDPYADGQHRGIDIAGPVGARVVAAAGGEVRFAGTAGSSGLTVSVRTSDGFDTSYLHLSSVSVREGALVSSGDGLGEVGITGSRSASEPHLHFGVREAGTRHAYRNPLDFLPPPGSPPVPDPPHPLARPSPVPAPFAPAPAPVGEPGRVPAGGRAPRRVPRQVPAGERTPRRVPAPRPVPAPRRVPARHRVPVGGKPLRRVPVNEPRRHPAPTYESVPRRIPVGESDSRRLPLGESAPREVAPGGAVSHALPEPAVLGPTPSGAAGGRPAADEPHSTGAQPATPPERDRPGLDIGWIMACVGLLLAAALLGLTEDGRKASREGGARLGRLVRPLTGRG